MRKELKFILSVILPLFAGAIGSVFTAPAVETWYRGLAKPSFGPPNWVFGPAWTILYILMGIALFLIWQKKSENLKAGNAMKWFFAQLVLNAFWPIAFFGMESPFAGLVVIIILWVLILVTVVKFFRISKTAGWLLIPYILWASFATVLNYFIFTLN